MYLMSTGSALSSVLIPWKYLVYLKYWTCILAPLMVYLRYDSLWI